MRPDRCFEVFKIMVANDYDDQFVGWVVDRDTFSRDFYISHCLLLNHSLSSSLSLTSIFWLYERDISVYINHINHQISHPFFDLGDLCICNQLLCSVASTAETTVNQAEIERKRPWPILRIRSGKRGLGLGGGCREYYHYHYYNKSKFVPVLNRRATKRYSLLN